MPSHNTAVNRVNFTRLTPSTPSDDQFCVNIVFIHGLSGHPRRTWEAAATKSKSIQKPSIFQRHSPEQKSSTVFWPQDYLVPDIPQACIWVCEYSADVVGGLFQAKSKNTVSQHGRNLAAGLEQDIRNTKPFIFVAHSTGGIILKDAIFRSDTVCDRTRQIVFLGTPHRGSGHAGWRQIAANLARVESQGLSKNITQALEVNSEVLDNIHGHFKEIVFNKGIKIHSFQEAHNLVGISGLEGKVVDDYSSKIDFPRALETVESLDANHVQMVKCSSRDDQVYRAIAGVLKASVRQIQSRGDSTGRG